MKICHASENQIEQLLTVYEHARDYMRQNGNPSQWGNGYPGREDLLQDLTHHQLYVCMEEENILAAFCFFQGNDPSYNQIYNGSWLNEKPYGVIHRVCVASHGKGIASFCLDWCFSQCQNLKIDTHQDNHPMQSLLKKNGFSYCGKIYLENGSERLAFQKSSL